MAQSINTNVSSLNAQRNLNKSQSSLQTSLQRLSSGLRINSAKDDAAGLAISERMTAQIRGFTQAARNANDGVSLSQTAEGAMAEATNILQRVRELSIQSANATNSSSDRAALQQEVSQLTAELDRIAVTTEFNGIKLLDGNFNTQQFQVGANANQTIGVGVDGIRTNTIGEIVNSAGAEAVAVAPTITNVNGTVAADATAGVVDSYNGVDANGIDQAGNTVTLNGSNVLSSSGYVGLTAKRETADSAYGKAAAINATGIGGVQATALTERTFDVATGSNFLDATTGGLGTGTSAIYTLDINGQAVLTSDGTTDITVAEAVENINSFTTTTGVRAEVASGGNLKLISDTGGNIEIDESFNVTVDGSANSALETVFSTFAHTGGGGIGDSTMNFTHRGQVTLTSGSAISVTAGQTQIGLAAGTNLISVDPNKRVSTLDISTQAGATDGILIVDSALNSINSSRAELGAIQSRFQSTVANLEISSENLAAARGRIRDTDFAVETANLTRTQILQQAGTAMLAQSNALPQNVLSLLG